MRIFVTLIFLGTLATTAQAQQLAPKLDSISQKYGSQMKPEDAAAYEAKVAGLKEKVNATTMKKVGDMAPDVELTNADGQPTTLKAMLASGPVLLTYYRGGWCPYCVVTLRMYESYHKAMAAQGVQLVAATGEAGPKLAQLATRSGLHYPLYTDKDLAGAKAFGIAYPAKPNVDLPLGAAYLIGKDGRIAYAFTETDYRRRAEPADLMAAIARLAPTPASSK